MSVTYDNDFKVTEQRVNGGNGVSYGYDDDGLVTNVEDLQISHNPENGMLTGTTLGNVTTQNLYNNYGELTENRVQVSGTDYFRTTYHLDAIGRIDTLVENVLGQTIKYAYQYDDAGRLKQVDRNDTTVTVYAYDDNGNRLSLTTPQVVVYGSYDDQDRMLSYGDANYGYTANGSLRYKAVGTDTTFYTYDFMGNLISVSLPNADFVEYLIDAQNRRIGKKLNGVLEKRWIYQDQLNPVAELDGNGNLISRFIYGDKGHVPSYMVQGDSTYRFITDHLGSVSLIINVASGHVAQYITYDEFGNVLSHSNAGFQPLGYAGGLFDAHTGLVRFGARDYDAGVGRWTTKDPILSQING